MNGENADTKVGIGRHLSMLSVWGLSFGLAVGWGAFVMPGAEFLPSTGPLGTVVGIVACHDALGVRWLRGGFPFLGGVWLFLEEAVARPRGGDCRVLGDVRHAC